MNFYEARLKYLMGCRRLHLNVGATTLDGRLREALQSRPWDELRPPASVPPKL